MHQCDAYILALHSICHAYFCMHLHQHGWLPRRQEWAGQQLKHCCHQVLQSDHCRTTEQAVWSTDVFSHANRPSLLDDVHPHCTSTPDSYTLVELKCVLHTCPLPGHQSFNNHMSTLQMVAHLRQDVVIARHPCLHHMIIGTPA
jgi:hypothetical protein